MTTRPRPPVAAVLAALLLAVLGLAACTGSDGADGAGDGTAEGAAAEGGSTTLPPRGAGRPIVRLGVTDWTGARLDAAVAEQLIERRLGYPVETVGVGDTGSMLADLERGDLHAVLELWPSSLLEPEQAIIDAGRVVELGELGVEGKLGWYMPRPAVEELGIDDWEALADPTVASALGGRFLGTDPGYEQYDEELIDTLGLPYEVTYSGSEAATAEAVAAAVAADRPILLYWWSPTALVARYDLVNVALPPRSAECVAEIEAGGPVRCDYPVDRLFKLGSPELATVAPEVERFLASFRLGTAEQLAMIDSVENQGRPVSEVAAAWIDANEAVWSAWLG